MWSYVWGDSLGFTVESRKRFRVIKACGMIWSHLDVGNMVSVFAKPDQNDFFTFWDHVKYNLWGVCVEGINDTIFFSS